jgi:hypothetical protein
VPRFWYVLSGILLSGEEWPSTVDQIAAFESIERLSALSRVPQINRLISTATNPENWILSH